MIVLDFETRSVVNIYDVGAFRYSCHPSTEILCLSFKIDSEDAVVISSFYNKKEYDVKLKILIEAFKKSPHIYAYNAFFERSIWNNVLTRYSSDVPILKIKNTHCLAARGAALGLPRSLSGLLRALRLTDKKDADGRSVMLKMCKPKDLVDGNPIWLDDSQSFEELMRYCKQDVLLTAKLTQVLPDLIPFERAVWQIDQKINTTGIPIDKDSVVAIKSLIEQRQLIFKKGIIKLTENKITSTQQVTELYNWLKRRGVLIDNLQKYTIETYLKANPDIDPIIAKVLKIRLYSSKNSTAKFDKFLNHLNDDNRIRGTLLYHGATTGRWSGGGIQPHNLPRNSIKNNDINIALDLIKAQDIKGLIKTFNREPMDIMSNLIRAVIKPPRGKMLLISDYSSIETRVLFWLSEHFEYLNKLSENKDIYVEMAASIYDCNEEDISSEKRHLGKSAILGCGYGMGAAKFKKQCSINNVIIDEPLAKKSILRYRQTYFKVVKLWEDIEKGFKFVINHPHETFDLNGLILDYKDDFLRVKLPSGRFIYYCRPWLYDNNILYLGRGGAGGTRWGELTTYGGKLVENITQAIARDILCYALYNLTLNEFKIILTVHDEIVCEVDDPYTADINIFNSLMVKRPPWACNLPLACDTFLSRSYTK